MDYDPKNKTKFAHLTNNALVAKYQNSPQGKKKNAEGGGSQSPSKIRHRSVSKSANGGSESEDDEGDGSGSDEDPENIWSCDDFAEHLQTNLKDKFPEMENIFRDKIYSQIKHYVKASTLSVQDMVNNRKNSFEFFGYDFMVDEDLNVWLIEVNSSPSMDTKDQPVLKKLVKSVLGDLVKVIVDYPKDKKSETG